MKFEYQINRKNVYPKNILMLGWIGMCIFFFSLTLKSRCHLLSLANGNTPIKDLKVDASGSIIHNKVIFCVIELPDERDSCHLKEQKRWCIHFYQSKILL